MDNAAEYEADIRIISIMRDDYELLEEIIEDLNDSDCKIIKAYLLEGRMFREIAIDEGRSYETIKKRIDKIRMEIWEDMEECLEKNCRGGMG
jgi:DNA-directed RNA polymerase specialized sigma24 family protein